MKLNSKFIAFASIFALGITSVGVASAAPENGALEHESTQDLVVYDLSKPVSFVLDPVRGKSDAGKTYVIDTLDTSEESGRICDYMLVTRNNSTHDDSAVHPDTDLIMTSHGITTTITDIESSVGGVDGREGEIMLGDEIVISIKLGPDGIFSGGYELGITCHPQTVVIHPEEPTPPPVVNQPVVPVNPVQPTNPTTPASVAPPVVFTPNFTG